MKCRVLAGAMRIQTRSDAQSWIAGEVGSHLPDPQWRRADLVGNTGGTISRIFRRIGMRGCPLYMHPKMVCELSGSGICPGCVAWNSKFGNWCPNPTFSTMMARRRGFVGQWRKGTLIAFVAAGCVFMLPPFRRGLTLWQWKMELFPRVPPRMR